MNKIILTILFLCIGINGQVIKTSSVNLTGYTTYVATAYCLRGQTASGERVRVGIVAADTSLLPIGSRINILGMGNYIVKDTGGDIKGRRIDVWVPRCSDAIKFGRRKIQVKKINLPIDWNINKKHENRNV